MVLAKFYGLPGQISRGDDMSCLRSLCVVLIIFPVSGYAFDLSPDETRHFSDPAFLPLSGQLTSGTTYAHADTSAERTGDIFGRLVQYKEKSDSVGQGFTYGLTDSLSVGALISFEERNVEEITPPQPFNFGNLSFSIFGFIYNTHSDGFTDPNFNVTYRAVDQADQPINLDIAAQYAPDLLPARVSSLFQGGTVAAGGQSAGLSVAASRVMTSLTVQTLLGATYMGDRRAIVVGDNSVQKGAAYYDYFASLRTQTRLDDLFSVDAGLTVSSMTGFRVSNANETVAYDTKYGLTTNSYVAMNSFIVPDRFYVRLEYDHDWKGTEKVTDIQSVTPGAWKNNVVNQVVVHFGALFF
jgi:hypothetical protein